MTKRLAFNEALSVDRPLALKRMNLGNCSTLKIWNYKTAFSTEGTKVTETEDNATAPDNTYPSNFTKNKPLSQISNQISTDYMTWYEQSTIKRIILYIPVSYIYPK